MQKFISITGFSLSEQKLGSAKVTWLQEMVNLLKISMKDLWVGRQRSFKCHSTAAPQSSLLQAAYPK